MIDTHAHIYDEAFDADRDEVLARARDAGLVKVFLPNINAATVEPMLALCSSHPGFCYPMLGLHPEDVRDDWSTVLDSMEARLCQPGHPFIAIGEVGLDFYWDQTYRQQQLEALRRQVGWAVRYSLPLMIHTRSAHPEMVDTLTEILTPKASDITCPSDNSPAGQFVNPADQMSSPATQMVNGKWLNGKCHDGKWPNGKCMSPASQMVNGKWLNGKCPGVFHCFGGTADEARELLSFEGFMLGIGGVVTFRKSNLPEVLREAVPLTRIVLETDSPYLAPVPHRGKRNETAFIAHVAERLADIYGCTTAEVVQITTQNAIKTFPKAV